MRKATHPKLLESIAPLAPAGGMRIGSSSLRRRAHIEAFFPQAATLAAEAFRLLRSPCSPPARHDPADLARKIP